MESSYSVRWEMGEWGAQTLELSSLSLITHIFQNAVCVKNWL